MSDTCQILIGSFLFAFIGYLIGSISPAIIISRKQFNTDVRQHHSRNAGAANAIRLMGRKWGIIILFSDGFKPIVATLLVYGLSFIKVKIFTAGLIYISGFTAIIGHCWPLYFRFQGGKGAASALGFLLTINPLFFLIALASWWIILYAWKMTSLSSILMVAVAFAISWIPGLPWTGYLQFTKNNFYFLQILIGLTWAIIIVRHCENIKRICAGEERKVNFSISKQKNSQ